MSREPFSGEHLPCFQGLPRHIISEYKYNIVTCHRVTVHLVVRVEITRPCSYRLIRRATILLPPAGRYDVTNTQQSITERGIFGGNACIENVGGH